MTRNVEKVSFIARALTPTEYKHAHSCQRKEHHVYRDDIVQDLFEAAGGQRYEDRHPALQCNRKGRNSSAIEPGESLEKKSVLGHRKIDSRRGQHALTQEADSGN